MMKKCAYILEAIAAYSFMGASFTIIFKSIKQYPSVLGFLLLFFNLMTFTLIREHYKNNRIIIFNKIDITIVGHFIYLISGVSFIYLFMMLLYFNHDK